MSEIENKDLCEHDWILVGQTNDSVILCECQECNKKAKFNRQMEGE